MTKFSFAATIIASTFAAVSFGATAQAQDVVAPSSDEISSHIAALSLQVGFELATAAEVTLPEIEDHLVLAGSLDASAAAATTVAIVDDVQTDAPAENAGD